MTLDIYELQLPMTIIRVKIQFCNCCYAETPGAGDVQLGALVSSPKIDHDLSFGVS